MATRQAGDWRKERAAILDSLGRRRVGGFGTPQQGRGQAPMSTMATTSAAGALGGRQIAYARVVEKMAGAKGPSPAKVAAEFGAAAVQDAGDSRRSELADAWGLQRELLAAAPARGVGGLRFLETAYQRYMQAVCEQDAAQARLGGVPGTVPLVRAFLNRRFDRPRAWPTAFEDMHDGAPVWAVLYYCLRAGDVGAAVEWARAAADAVGEFYVFLREYAAVREGRQATLPEAQWKTLLSAFRRSVRSSQDPFQQAVYVIVGRCDIEWSHPLVVETAQDFCWLRLALVRPAGSPAYPALFSAQDYSLADLQETLVSYGAEHFAPRGTNQLLYFQVLLLSEQYERAVRYLSSVPAYAADAVHFAAVISYAKLLPSKAQAGDGGLDVAGLVSGYVQSFAHSNPGAAMAYLKLVPAASERLELMRELLLSTREYDVLLGAVQADRVRMPGVCDKLLSDEERRRLAADAARASLSRGMAADAVKLYDLAEEYDRVLDTLCAELSQLVTVPGEELQRVARLAAVIDEAYRANGCMALVHDAGLKATFAMLLRLVEFFSVHSQGRFEEALAVLDQTGLLPTSGDASEIERKVEAFKRLEEGVRRNTGAVLLAAMTALYRLYEEGKASAGGESLARLAARGRALITFSSMIEYRLPADVNSRLVRLSVFMS